MSDALWSGLGLAWIALLAVDIAVTVLYPLERESWSFLVSPIFGLLSFLLAVGAFLFEQWFSVVVFSAYCVYSLWRWWHDECNRRRRKKLLDKASGRVAEVGGRLRIVRPNEG
jgi:type II secretory pathway component PulF